MWVVIAFVQVVYYSCGLYILESGMAMELAGCRFVFGSFCCGTLVKDLTSINEHRVLSEDVFANGQSSYTNRCRLEPEAVTDSWTVPEGPFLGNEDWVKEVSPFLDTFKNG